MDGTYRINQNGYVLYHVIVTDNHDYSQSVLVAFVSAETQSHESANLSQPKASPKSTAPSLTEKNAEVLSYALPEADSSLLKNSTKSSPTYADINAVSNTRKSCSSPSRVSEDLT